MLYTVDDFIKYQQLNGSYYLELRGGGGVTVAAYITAIYLYTVQWFLHFKTTHFNQANVV